MTGGTKGGAFSCGLKQIYLFLVVEREPNARPPTKIPQSVKLLDKEKLFGSNCGANEGGTEVLY